MCARTANGTEPDDGAAKNASNPPRRARSNCLPAAQEYWGASTDDSKVFYTEGEDLYEYTLPVGQVAGHVTALTHAGKVQGVVQVSEDGSYVYFVADAVLETARRGRVDEGKDSPNLYVSHEAVRRCFIATLSANDASDWAAAPAPTPQRSTPDGARLAFTSEDSLTGYDNQQAEHGECEGQFGADVPEAGHRQMPRGVPVRRRNGHAGVRVV